MIDNMVINKSSENFNEEKIGTFKTRMNFTPKPMKIPFLDLGIDAETAIKFTSLCNKEIITLSKELQNFGHLSFFL